MSRTTAGMNTADDALVLFKSGRARALVFTGRGLTADNRLWGMSYPPGQAPVTVHRIGWHYWREM